MEKPRAGRGRRPAAEVRAAALGAAADLLLSEGLHAVTHERVARAAAVSKTTLYKWWPSAGALAAEAYFARSEEPLRFVFTGDLRADLIAQLSAFVRHVTGEREGRAIRGLIAGAQSDPVLAGELSRAYSLPRRAMAVELLGAARDAGHLRADADLEVMVDQLWGACYHRLLFGDLPVTEAFAVALVDHALRGAAPTRPR